MAQQSGMRRSLPRLEMERSSSTNHPAPLFDPLGQPFRLLKIDPSSTAEQIAEAYALALQQDQASPQILANARNAIQELDRRLSYELAYPIDSAVDQIEPFYAALSSDKSAQELFQLTERLAPLSCANFFACLGGRRPIDSVELLALLEAQASVDANEIYDILRSLRNRAGFPRPSLASVSQGLLELFAAQGEAVLSAYDSPQRAAQALSECAKVTLASSERYRIEALSSLVNSYRRSTDAVRSKANAAVGDACAGLQQQPDDALAIGKLTDALAAWALLCQPLMALDAHQGHHDLDVEVAIDHVRALLADLSAHHYFETSRIVIDLARAAFGSAPASIRQFEQAALLLQKLSCEAEIKTLHESIEQAISDPGMVKALESDGFGVKSSQPVLDLWQPFCRAIDATKASEYADRPWMLIRNLASKLGDRSENFAATSMLLSGAIQYAENDAADPAIIETFRTDLRDLQDRYPGVTSGKRGALGRFGKRALLAGSTLIGVFCAFFLYRHFEPAILTAISPTPTQPTVQASKTPDPEVIPPAGKGQRLALSSVRYCRFQEERLRIVKQHVNGPDDVRAYNMLASDYNARCSDFFFQDQDQKTVLDEIAAKRNLLEADAMRILATWPWHAVDGTISTSK
jgi:hypothetical protein